MKTNMTIKSITRKDLIDHCRVQFLKLTTPRDIKRLLTKLENKA